MNVSIILGHPNPGSFNHALASAAREVVEEHGGRCFFHDLQGEGFDPLLPACELLRAAVVHPRVIELGREIQESDGIIIVHPNWWGQPPAILKGWLDRVLRMDLAYKFGVNDSGEGVPIGLLKGKWAIVFNTSNTAADREAEMFGDPLENLWRTCVFGFCGIEDFTREVFAVVITSTPEERAGWIERARRIVSSKVATSGPAGEGV